MPADCTYKTTAAFCTSTLALTATSGFDSYKWEKTSGKNTGQKGTGQTLTISEPGTYKVMKTKTGCPTLYEEFSVATSTYNKSHPIGDMIRDGQLSGEVYYCPDNGREYPQIYLCGEGTTLTMLLDIQGAIGFSWQQRGTCSTPPSNQKCPLTDSCVWNSVGNASTHTFTAAGDYRVRISYPGGCESPYYYFRITKNTLSTTLTYRHIVCNTKGVITVNNQASGYVYALMKDTATITGYQATPTFEIANPGLYKILIKQTTISSTEIVPCVYEAQIQINKYNPTITVTTKPYACDTNLGQIRVVLNNMPYLPVNYILRQNNALGNILVNTGATKTTDLTILGASNGLYYVEVQTAFDCSLTKGGVKIEKIPELKLEAATTPIVCNNATTIEASAQGGKKSSFGYTFELTGNSLSLQGTGENSYTFTVTTVGTYQVKVTDANNCTTVRTVTVTELPPPTIGPITYELYACGAKGKIVFPKPQSTVSYTYQYKVTAFLPTFQDYPLQDSREIENLPAGISVTPHIYYSYGGKTCIISPADMTIPQLNSNNTLIASAGVAQLVGCATETANIGKALVHFTNIQGGQPPYGFSFDGGLTWTDTRQMWLSPATYNLSVRDKIGCARENLQVIVKDKPDAPAFSQAGVIYDCQGRGSVTIQNNKPNYTYKYQLDGGAETSTAQFSQLALGVHTITIRYDDPSVTQPSILLKEDFGKGNPYTTPPSGMTSAYTLIDPRTQALGWNLYFVAGQKDLIATKVGWWNGSAMFPNDHTNPTDNSSRFLAVDFGELIPQGAVFYEKDVQDVLPNQPIEFEMFGFNLVKSSACVCPVMIMEVVALDDSGNVVIEGGNEKILGRIESEEIPGNGGDDNAWFRFASDGTGVNTGVSSVVKVNPGTYKRLKIRVRTKHNTRSCNDFAFDDLTVYQSPISCGFTQSVTVQIVDGKQFGVNTSTEHIINAKCRGGQGQYRIQLKNLTGAQYWYSVNGAAFVASTPGDDSFVWNGYAGNYTVRFRATATSTDCEVTRLFTITQPNLINLSIEGNSVLGCTPPTTGVHSITAQG